MDWIVAHWQVLLAPLIYELWSLIPAEKVKSSSVLTWIGELVKSLKAK